MTANVRGALNCLNQDSEPYKFLNYYHSFVLNSRADYIQHGYLTRCIYVSLFFIDGCV